MMSRNGFSLIEVIVVLILIGVVGIFAGFGLLNGVHGLLLARENAELSQKIQVAVERMQREFTDLSEISSFSSTAVTFLSPHGVRTIGRDGDVIRLVVGSGELSTGQALLGGVTLFELEKFEEPVNGTYGSVTSLALGMNLSIAHGTSDTIVTLSSRIDARNSGLLNSPLATGE